MLILAYRRGCTLASAVSIGGAMRVRYVSTCRPCSPVPSIAIFTDYSQDIDKETKGTALLQTQHKRHVDRFLWAEDAVRQSVCLGHRQGRARATRATVGILQQVAIG